MSRCPDASSLADIDVECHLHPRTDLVAHKLRGPRVIVRGDGAYLHSEDGRTYLDAMSGLWCTALGLTQPRLVRAATEQMERLPFCHVFHHQTSDVTIELARQLIKIAPAGMSKALFHCSGSEANDAAIKIAWYYQNAQGHRRKKRIMSHLHSYHGSTVAAASLTGMPEVHAEFDLPLAQFMHVPCPDRRSPVHSHLSPDKFGEIMAAEVEKRIETEGAENIAAFFVEPVMAAAGIVLPPQSYLVRLQDILKRNRILLIADEVICGFGRTGRMWGSETFTIRPDMITCGKALSAGFYPISAVMLSEEVHDALLVQSKRTGLFNHGFTYGGSPVGAAVALEVLRIYREMDLVNHVAAKALTFEAFLTGMLSLTEVEAVRSCGLLGAVDLIDPAPGSNRKPFAARVADCAQELGLLVRSVDGTVVLCPPLTASDGDLAAIFHRLREAVEAARIQAN